MLEFLSSMLLLVLGAVAFRMASAGTRLCVTCGRDVPEDQELVELPDLRLCRECVDRGVAEFGRQELAAEERADRCHFRGSEANADCPVLRYPQAALCRDCLHACQASLQPDPAWFEPEAERRKARDEMVAFLFWAVAMAISLASMARSCVE